MSAFMSIAPYCPLKSFCEAFVRTSKAFNKQLRTEGHITSSKLASWERSIEKAWGVNGHALQSSALQGAPQKPRLPPGRVSEPPLRCVTGVLAAQITVLCPVVFPFSPATFSSLCDHVPQSLCRSSLWATQEQGARDWRAWEGSILTSLVTYWMDSM